MRKIIFIILFLPIVYVCFGKPVRSNLGGECQTYVEEDGIVIPDNPTAADYVQDGLCIMWDGIENVDWGEHSDDITTWTDLIGGLTIPNVVVVDGVAIDHTKNGYYKYFTRIRDIVSSAYMTFEIASLDQEANYSWCQRTRNGGTEWTPSLYSNWHYFTWFRKYLSFPADTRFPNTRSLSADGETVRGYCGGKFYSDCSVEEPHIDEGRCLFYSGVKICCVRFYDRPLSEEEIKYNNLIDKIRFGF